VIVGWPCQGQTRAGHGEGLRDPRSCMFWEMLWVLHHFQTHQARAPAYILENVPLLGDTRTHVMASVHKIQFQIGPAVLLDAARVGSHAHRPRLRWTNLLPREVLKRAYETIPRSSHLIMDSILDIG
jgi:site-specific DNA-cytosine methylase